MLDAYEKDTVKTLAALALAIASGKLTLDCIIYEETGEKILVRDALLDCADYVNNCIKL